MKLQRVERADDARLRGYALVARPAALQQAGWFIAEGRLVVERVLAERRHSLESVLLNEAALVALEPALREASAPIYLCPNSLFEALTGHDFHRGCLALVRRPPPLDWRTLAEPARSLIVLEGVANHDNIGGVFRNAAAFGADAVLLDPSCADPLYRKAIRTSMAASLRVPFATIGADDGARWPQCLNELAARGFELVAFTPGAGACDLDEFAAAPRAERLALLFGSEGAGLSERVLAACATRLRISIRPDVDSLNLAVACGIGLQRLLPRRATGVPADGGPGLRRTMARGSSGL
jgi:tRNA G18 (ribose-2'-O)-methylase SpoU